MEERKVVVATGFWGFVVVVTCKGATGALVGWFDVVCDDADEENTVFKFMSEFMWDPNAFKLDLLPRVNKKPYN